MGLDNASFLGRTLRRTGRFGIALLSLAGFFLAFGVVYLATALTMGVWFPKVCLLAGAGAALGIYTLCDRLDLIPEDPDKIVTLSLTESANQASSQPWVSSDFDTKG